MSGTARHLILVGLPGAGKTTAGRLVAATLGTWFLDLDEAIEEREGSSIPEIFARRGEAAFRGLEREMMAEALARPPGVIAAGGGWAAQPGNLETARAGTDVLVLYLNTSVATAAARTAGTGHRPLLGRDHHAALARLLAEREPFYRQADEQVSTDDRTPAEVAAEIVALARKTGGW